MRLSLRVDGAAEAAGELRRGGDRLRRLPGLDRAGDRMVEAIRTATRGGDVPGPALAPATLERRRRGGYGSGPPLVRTGALADAVDVLALEPTAVDVGIREERAAVLGARWDLFAAVDGVVDEVLAGLLEEALA